MGRVCGVDEAGRGPLAGPVFAAAVVLDDGCRVQGLADSKKLSPRTRERLAVEIREKALDWSIAWATVAEIDALNILNATMLAMRRAIEGLHMPPDEVLVDGNRVPGGLAIPSRAIVGGDATVAEISAASILAKTARDSEMQRLHRERPEYGLDRHMGYGTAVHLAALKRFGPAPFHRRSFAPVRDLLAEFGEPQCAFPLGRRNPSND